MWHKGSAGAFHQAVSGSNLSAGKIEPPKSFFHVWSVLHEGAALLEISY